jgi:hypothetical protein
MARSMAVVLLAVGVVVAITLRSPGQAIRVVDYRSLAQQTAPFAPFRLLLPQGLSAGWQATSDYYDPPEVTGIPGVSDWEVGFVTPDRAYAGFDQTQASATVALAGLLTEPTPAGSQRVAGRTWQRVVDQAGTQRALVTTVGSTTLVVHGTASWQELGDLAEALVGHLPPGAALVS